MSPKQKIMDEVEKALTSMDSLKNIEPNHFIFTRINSALENDALSNITTKLYLRLVKQVVLVLLVLINMFTIITSFEKLSNRKTSTYSLEEILRIDYSFNESQISN